MSVRVLIADDQALARAGFRRLLESEPGIDVVGEAGDGLQAVELARRKAPDVVLMDIRMPTVDGLEATRRVVAGDGAARVVILTTFDLDEYVFDAIRAGASGFLLKDSPPEQLIAAIDVVAAGEALLAPSITRRLIEQFARHPAPRSAEHELAELTPHELGVLKLLARGLSNAEIAAELVLGEATIKTHVAHVLMKLGLLPRWLAVSGLAIAVAQLATMAAGLSAAAIVPFLPSTIWIAAVSTVLTRRAWSGFAVSAYQAPAVGT